MNRMSHVASKTSVESQPPIFQQQWWWLNIAKEQCRSLDAIGDDGIVNGSFHYWARPNRVGMPFGYNPPLSHLTGFAINQSLTPSEQNTVIEELISRLPDRTSFHFVFDAKAANAFFVRKAFQAAGFCHSTHRTYLRPPGHADVLSGIKNPEHKRRINAAEKKLEAESVDVNKFLEMYEENLKAKREQCHFPPMIAKKIIEEGLRRGQIYILALKNTADAQRGREGNLHRTRYDAAMACAVDPCLKRVYYWMSTRACPTLDYKPQRDAPKVLVKKAMEYAQALKFTFDADGASTVGAEEFQKNSLGLQEWEDRDVFVRLTWPARLYEGWRPRMKTIVSFLKAPATA